MNKPKTITNAQAAQLIDRLNFPDQILIRLGIESGLRISDILKLRVGDVRKKKIMTIYEMKSKRERTFKISDELYRDLKKWTRYKKNSAFVFTGARGPSKSIHRATIHRRIKNALQGLKFSASAHSTRKLFAYNTFCTTQNIKMVQDALHHRNFATTLAYLDIDLEKIVMSQKNDAT